MSEVLLKQLIHEVKSLRARMNALETAEVIPSQLQASDGDPNPAFSADASGNLTQADGLYIATDEIRARDAGGLKLFEGSGTYGIFVQDATGNMGLNTTDVEAWSSLFAIESINTAIVFGRSGLDTFIGMTGNAYYDGAYKYKTTDEATMYYQYQGGHVWRVVASGTINTPITWINAMTMSVAGAVWMVGNCSALSFTDRSPVFVGDALTALKKIKAGSSGEGDWCELDHNTLPERLRKGTKEEPGRDLGANIQLNSRAICQLDARLDKLEKRKL